MKYHRYIVAEIFFFCKLLPSNESFDDSHFINKPSQTQIDRKVKIL